MISDRIAAANDLVDIFDLSGYPHQDTPLKIHCPFHDDSRRSARLYPATNSLFCFTESKTWDAVAFVADREGVTMAEACGIIEKGACVRWKRRGDGSASEFWRMVRRGLSGNEMLARLGGSSDGGSISLPSDPQSVLMYRWELQVQGLDVAAAGGEVDWDEFDRAHCDVVSLRRWSQRLLDTLAEIGQRERRA